MNGHRGLFARSDFVPWTFRRIVVRDYLTAVRLLSCAEQLRSIGFAFSCSRESPRRRFFNDLRLGASDSIT